MRRLITILFLVSQISIQVCIAQKTMKFEHFSVRDGLSDEIVTSIIQDQQGFIWFGTYKGLNRFDGQKTKQYQYNPDNPNSIHANMVSCLFEDHLGYIWIGSFSNGISKYDPSTGNFIDFDSGLADSTTLTDHSIRVIFEDQDQELWIGTEFGLSRYDNVRDLAQQYICDSTNCSGTINGKTVYDVISDKNGNIWIATENKQLCLLNKSTGLFEYVTYTDLELPNKDDHVLKNLHFQNDSILWVASNHGGLSKLNIHSRKYKSYPPTGDETGPSSQQIRDIINVGNTLWLATDGAGLDVFDPQTEQFLNFRNQKIDQYSLSSNVLWDFYVDHQDIVWIATYQGGVNKYDPGSNLFELIENNPIQSESIPNNPILSIFESNDNTIWVGTDWGGLCKISTNGSIKTYNTLNSDLKTDVIKSIGQTKNGYLLLGSYNDGLTCFDPIKETFLQFKRNKNQFSGLTSNHVWAIYNDSEDRIWLGTLGGGIVEFNESKRLFQPIDYKYETGGQLHIYHVFEDGKSNLWFSTDDGIILYQRISDEWQHFKLDSLIPESNHEINQVKSVFEDDYRNLWIATASGLVKYDQKDETFHLIASNHELPELPLLQVSDGGYGNLMLVTKTYITIYDPIKEKCTSYRVSDNNFQYNTITHTNQGKTLIGGTKGITAFNPSDIRPNKHLPEVYLTNIQIFNKPVDLKQSIEQTTHLDLQFDQNTLTFEFAALNFSESNRNLYSYQLMGFDEDWSSPVTESIATYTNLDPGDYQFKVKASNNHNLWNEEGATLAITINPPYYATWWFRSVASLVVGAVLLIIIRLRLQQIKRRYEYERISKEREVIAIRNDQLKEQLVSTKNELNNITMSYIHKNQKLQQVRSTIFDSASKINGQEKRLLNRIIKDIDREMQDHDYWDKFEHQFNLSHDNFLDRFKQKYPDLSKRELRVCAYLRMGLDNQEIATLMNVTIRTVETSRYRIRKKINMEERQSFTKMILRF